MSIVAYAASSDESDEFSDDDEIGLTKSHHEPVNLSLHQFNPPEPLHFNIHANKQEIVEDDLEEFVLGEKGDTFGGMPLRAIRNKGRTQILLSETDCFLSSSDDDELEAESQQRKRKLQNASSSQCFLDKLPKPKFSSSDADVDEGWLSMAKRISQPRMKSKIRKTDADASNVDPLLEVLDVVSDVVDDDDDEDGTGANAWLNDFFSLNPTNVVVDPEMVEKEYETLKRESLLKAKSLMSRNQEEQNASLKTTEEADHQYVDPISYNHVLMEASCHLTAIDKRFNDDVSKLAGKDGIEWIEVKADNLIKGNKEAMLRNLTVDDSKITSAKCGREPDITSKRKHQMTYLAYLAKSREQDLKNQWAQNRHNRRESRAKYGF